MLGHVVEMSNQIQLPLVLLHIYVSSELHEMLRESHDVLSLLCHNLVFIALFTGISKGVQYGLFVSQCDMLCLYFLCGCAICVVFHEWSHTHDTIYVVCIQAGMQFACSLASCFDAYIL